MLYAYILWWKFCEEIEKGINVQYTQERTKNDMGIFMLNQQG